MLLLVVRLENNPREKTVINESSPENAFEKFPTKRFF